MRKKILFIFIMLCAFILVGCGEKKETSNTSIKTSEIIFKKLKFDLPTIFEIDHENSKDDMLFYNTTDENGYMCSLFVSNNNYQVDNIEEEIGLWLTGDYEKKYSTRDINGNTWTIGTTSSGVKQTIYAINYDNEFYMLSYDSYGKSDECSKFLNDYIVKSLKF